MWRHDNRHLCDGEKSAAWNQNLFLNLYFPLLIPLQGVTA
jgi:hypothetical protein